MHALWRKRRAPLPRVVWRGKTKKLRAWTKSNTDLSNAELAEHLVHIARHEDDGAPKTGRGFFYLALSHGYINPDMTDTDAAKRSRDAAYDRVTGVLGEFRKSGDIGWGDVLDLTRTLDERTTFESPCEARAALRHQYSEDRWLGQLFYPTLIVEKDTLEPICLPIARTFQMPFASSRGYSSLTLCTTLLRCSNAAGQRRSRRRLSSLSPTSIRAAWIYNAPGKKHSRISACQPYSFASV